jgi:AcrR family transcriptional regulator
MNLKERIIEIGYDLFAENGYDKTSVAQIIKEAGTSKGGFYHHFKSKEDILEIITFRYIDIVKSYYLEILESTELSINDKFIESYYKLGEYKRKSMSEWQKIEKLYDFKGNHILLKRMGDSFQEITQEFYEELIQKGINEGVFETKYPKQLASIWSREVMQFHRTVRHLLLSNKSNEEEFYQLLEFNEEFINNQLSLDENKIPIVSMGKEYLEKLRKTAKIVGSIKN